MLLKRYYKFLIYNLTTKKFDARIALTKYSFLLSLFALLYSFIWIYFHCKLSVVSNLVSFVLLQIIAFCSYYFPKKKRVLTYLLFIVGFFDIFVAGIATWHVYPSVVAWFLIIPIFVSIFFSKTTQKIITVLAFLLLLSTPLLNYLLYKLFPINPDIYYNIWLNVSMIFGAGVIVYWISLENTKIRDQEQHKLEQQNQNLVNIQNQLIKEQQYKERFFENISHEIRTPMNAIIGIGGLLKFETPEAEKIELLDSLTKSSNHLLSIINDLLDFNRIEENKLNLISVEYNIKSILLSCIDLIKFSKINEQVAILKNIDESTNIIVKGDPNRLTQIILNILNNAVKYTEKGKIEITAKTEKSEDEKCVLTIIISDTGIGISETEIDKIYDPFALSDLGLSKKDTKGGARLGLNIAKKLIELKGGSIACESTLNIGTTFTVNIPLLVIQTHQVVNENAKQMENVSNSPKSILIVDDNQINLMVAEKIINKFLPNVKTAKAMNGKEAVAIHAEQNFDLILMDILMPEMDGIEATKQIRNTLPAPQNQVPIVAMTANVNKEDADNSYHAGMNDFLNKPFQNTQLINILKKYLITP